MLNRPLRWAPGKNIAWQADLPGYGQSRPTVWRGVVYVTTVEGANKETLHLSAYDAKTGKLRWRRSAPASTTAEAVYTVARAAPTPVADKDGVYAFFESGDFLAFSHAGQPRWTRALFAEYGKFDNGHGCGTSPVQNANSLFVLVDHLGPSYLLALDKKTGRNRWKTTRESKRSWTSPLLVKRGKSEELVVSSAGTVHGYAASTGERLWELTGITGNNIPSPTTDGEHIFIGAATSPRESGGRSAAESNQCLTLTEKDGKPSVELKWQAKKAVCSYMSPTPYRGLVYYVNAAGVLFCLDVTTGEEKYSERIDGECWMSPIPAGDFLYFFARNGKTTVVKAGPVFEKVATNTLWPEGEPPMPSLTVAEPKRPEGAGAAPRPGGGPPPGASRDSYLDPIVYGATLAEGAFFIRVGTRLWCVPAK